MLMYPEAYNIQAALPQLTPSMYRLHAKFRIETYTATTPPQLARSLDAFVVKAVLHHEVLIILRSGGSWHHDGGAISSSPCSV